MNDRPLALAKPEPASQSPRGEREAARDLMQAGYRPATQPGHIQQPHGAATITTERVWSAMRAALAKS